ncbi:VOC family protein [Actinokineospora xionganensis]|uniref:VOC family protein n=1 Tax=Actinokineospora xionganensis TaxID=2684470 RepID=A0ABR7L5S6_9PSEU|nr:VOC family protein [Actinokineospora xionganensis]MBC6447878.1 VOC family protein [Actinokineospora xionganensis]
MSHLSANQPLGTPTWIDLGIPDLDRAMAFYHALFGWEFDIGPAETGHYTTCLLDGKRAAAIMPNPDPAATDFWWNVYLATDDCDATVERVRAAGGTVLSEPMDVMEQGRMAIVKDPVGAQFGLWQGNKHIGAEVVNEPNSFLRNDLVTPDAALARPFYAAVFDFTLDGNPDLPDLDFTFLRRPDGHEIGGIVGEPTATKSSWGTLFQVDDCHAAVERVVAAGGTADAVQEMVYGNTAAITDPFGVTFDIGSPPSA